MNPGDIRGGTCFCDDSDSFFRWFDACRQRESQKNQPHKSSEGLVIQRQGETRLYLHKPDASVKPRPVDQELRDLIQRVEAFQEQRLREVILWAEACSLAS